MQMQDLYAQYEFLKNEIDSAINEVIKNSQFIRGPHVNKFEEEFAKLTNTKECISVANGTDAIYIALSALGVKEGDEVIVPAMSWISTSETVTQAGAKPIFADININDYTISIEEIKKKISHKTVGIIPVHLYGNPCNMKEIGKFAKSNNLWIIEDCAQAHLAEYSNRLVGTFGDISTFSFYPGKNLGAMGDAGAIVSNSKDLAYKCRIFARHGGEKKNEHLIEGINSRMDGLQAAILNIKINHLSDWHHVRSKVAKKYSSELNDIEQIILPKENVNQIHAWHLYVIRSNRRDELKEYLESKNIPTSINYPSCLPLLPCYKSDKYLPKDFKNAYTLSKECLSLPLCPFLKSEDQDKVISEIKAFFGG